MNRKTGPDQTVGKNEKCEVCIMDKTKIGFSNSVWVSLISIIGGAVAANLILIYGLSMNLYGKMDSLDDKWHDRVSDMSNDFHNNITNLKNDIPPVWFKEKVYENEQHIKNLESEFTRDFVRHSELKVILENMKKGTQ